MVKACSLLIDTALLGLEDVAAVVVRIRVIFDYFYF